MRKYVDNRFAAMPKIGVKCYLPERLAHIVKSVSHDFGGSCDDAVEEALLEWLEKRGWEEQR